MNGLLNNKKSHLNIFFIFILFLFQLLYLVNPKLLNNIIRIGEDNLRYIHFSFNENGDMILDTSSYPVSQLRKFFGLKKNGRFFFNDTNNEETPFYIVYSEHTKGRLEGESYFIKLTSSNSQIHGRELMLGVSKNYDSDPGLYTEIYNLNNKNMTKYLTSDVFGNIISDTFTIIKVPDASNSIYYYIFTYIICNSNTYYLMLKKTYFSFDLTEGFKHVSSDSRTVAVHRRVSCFYTEKTVYICLYLSIGSNLRIRAYNSDFTDSVRTSLYNPSSYVKNLFFKSIHFKKEIGAFIYFKSAVTYPTISILQCNDDKSMTAYSNFGEIDVQKATFNLNNMLNDMIKLNDFQICYISTSADKLSFQIVIFTLYKDDKLMNIRYYQIEMWNEYTSKIYLDLKCSLYKNFLSLGFSHCPKEECTSSIHLHYASLIIFSYPNSTDSSLDIIPQLYYTNKKIENDFSFNFEGALIIENNLFGLIFKGTRIMNYPQGLNLTNTTNRNILKIESIISKDENVSLYFNTHENFAKNDYIIEYAYVLEEPNYDDIKKYYNDTDYTYGENIESEKNYYQKYEYTGRSSYFTIQISENLITNCKDESCELCFSNYTCITCIYNYTFNNKIKTCLPKPAITTILTTIPKTIPKQIIYTTIPTTIQEQNIHTAIPTTIPKENIYTTILTTIPKQIIFTTIPTTIPKEYITTFPENSIPLIPTTYPDYLENCKEIVEGKCNEKISSEQIKEIYNKLKNSISKESNELIETENVIFQISSLEEQKNNNNPNVSSIDLAECEQLLKEQEELSEDDDLIILKTDIKSENLSSIYVQYEIYNPITLNIISLDICSDIPISISVPINMDESTKSIYDSLRNSGYNLFDLNDSFYNDICSTYTTENGTDLTLSDRKNKMFDNNANISMCQIDCTFQFFNKTTNKAKCDCAIQKEEIVTNISKITFDKNELVDSFFNTLKNSNFLVLKCYKLVFSKQGQNKNIGSYIMSAISFIFIILMLVYFINGDKKLKYFIQMILKLKLNYNSKSKIITNKKFENNKNNINNKNKFINSKLFEKNNNKKKIERIETYNNKTNKKLPKAKVYKKSKFGPNKNNNKQKNKKKPIKKEKNNTNFPPKKQENLFTINNEISKRSKNILISLPDKEQLKSRSKNNLIKIKKRGKNKVNNNNILNINNKNYKVQDDQSSKLLDIKLNKNNSIQNNVKYLNDEELNNLEYEIAIVSDKRTYFQYYLSLLKKKHLILFAFYPANDYNLISVKISLLLLSFSLYFTINGFFFSDATMNKINEDKGEFDFLYQIPQILYSTIISAFINMILKRLSLSENQILMIKSEKDYLSAQKKSNRIIICLNIKLAIFFIFSFILMLFFWYFISSFCAVYKNTQIILIEDTLLSFALSMIYPFGLNLLPGIIRIPALRAPKRDKKCLYKASGLIALI